MSGNYIIGIIGIAGLMVAWVAVQSLWRKIFIDEVVDRDVLAGRSDCGNCSCLTPCSVKNLGKEKNKK